jgi:hypothetical protein
MEWLVVQRNTVHQEDVSIGSVGSNTGVIMGNVNYIGPNGVSIVGSSMVVCMSTFCEMPG